MSEFVSAYYEVGNWPLLARRAFLLTLPVSGPVWLFGGLILGIGIAIWLVASMLWFIAFDAATSCINSIASLWKAQ